MIEFNDAIVQGGKVVLSHLPYADGKRLRIVVAEDGEAVGNRVSISQIRQILKGGVERFDDPFEPMIPNENWEMLK